MFVFFNSTFLPLFALGLMDMPRRVSTYAPHLQTLNDWVSVSAFALGISMLVFLVNLVYSYGVARIPADANPWQSRGLEWQVPTPVPLENFDEIPTILAGPYDYGDANAPPVARLGHVRPSGRRRLTMAIVSDVPTDPPPGRALFVGARLFVAADAFFFLGFLFAYLYLRALNSNGLWHPPAHPTRPARSPPCRWWRWSARR